MNEREQQMAELRDAMPRMWWNLYQGYLMVGFTPYQAFSLVQTAILGIHSGGIRPNNVDGPNPDTEV